MHKRDIPYRVQNRPLEFEASCDYFNKDGISSINADNRVIAGNTHAQNTASRKKFNLLHMACQAKILAHTHVAY